MKILMAESSTAIGGQELAVIRHAKGLTERGHTVQVIVQRGSPIAELARQHGIRTHIVSMRRMTVSAMQAFRNILLTEKPHLLHVNSSRDSWLGALAARCIRPRIKVVKTRHISAPLNRNLPTRLLYRRLFDHVIVTGGPTNKRGLVERDGLKPERVSAFPIGVDCHHFSPGPPAEDLRVALRLPPTHRLVGVLSYLRSYKGHRYFIEAAAQILARCKDVTFLIIGEGPEKVPIETYIRTLGISEYMLMLGYREDSLSALRSLDVFVMPSIEGDTIPQVLPEAMAVGLPVIATTTGSIPDIIEDGVTGLLVPPRNSHALSLAIERLLDNRSLAQSYGDRAHRLVTQNYSLEAMLTRLETVYQQI